MAAPAIIGFRSPAAASGSAATLYPKTHTRLPLIVASVLRDSRIASAASMPTARATASATARFPGEQYRPQPQGAQFPYGLGAGVLDRVGDGDDTECHAVPGHHDS